jgi:hypothetical protein
MQFPEGEVQHVVLAENIEWTPCPAHLPPGCQITVLEGSPNIDLINRDFEKLPTPIPSGTCLWMPSGL